MTFKRRTLPPSLFKRDLANPSGDHPVPPSRKRTRTLGLMESGSENDSSDLIPTAHLKQSKTEDFVMASAVENRSVNVDSICKKDDTGEIGCASQSNEPDFNCYQSCEMTTTRLQDQSPCDSSSCSSVNIFDSADLMVPDSSSAEARRQRLALARLPSSSFVIDEAETCSDSELSTIDNSETVTIAAPNANDRDSDQSLFLQSVSTNIRLLSVQGFQPKLG